jgi:hypothetical protein
MKEDGGATMKPILLDVLMPNYYTTKLRLLGNYSGGAAGMGFVMFEFD